MALGEGDYKYELVEGWAKLPEGWVFSLVSDAAIDSKGRNLRLYPRQTSHHCFRQGWKLCYLVGVRGVRYFPTSD